MDSLSNAPSARNDFARGGSHKIEAIYLAARADCAVRFRRGAPEAVGRSSGLPMAQHARCAPARGASLAAGHVARNHERHRLRRWRRARAPWARFPSRLGRGVDSRISRSAEKPRFPLRARRVPALFDGSRRAAVRTLPTMLGRAGGAS